MGFAEEMRRQADAIWEAQHAHPFVRGIGDGTVDPAAFAHWVRQDYAFLVDYCRLFALAAARAPDLATIGKFGELLRETAVTEMDLHRAYAADIGITPEELEAEVASPTTRGYVDFLLRTATVGDYLELIAALAPCMWGFSEIGQRLAARPRPADRHYAAWIDMYAAPEFAALASWCRELLDRMADQATPEGRVRAADAFMTSSRYELRFWEAALRRETWERPA